MRIAGYAAVFDWPDKGGDVVRAGAFKRAIERAGEVPLLWQHKGAPVGRIDALLSRLFDTVLAFPGLLLALAVAVLLGKGVHNAGLAAASAMLSPDATEGSTLRVATS